jgi:hypothetical protein
MKLTQTLICTMAVGAMIFAADKASAFETLTNAFPLATLNVSGVITYQTNDVPTDNTNKHVTTLTCTKEKFTSRDIIDLLNESPTFTNVLYDVKGVMQVPANSYLIFNIANFNIFVTNTSGFSFQLTDVFDPVVTNYFTFVSFETSFLFHPIVTKDAPFASRWTGSLVSSLEFNDVNFAGRETDLLSFALIIDDNEDTILCLFGVAKLDWSFSKVKNGAQTVSFSLKCPTAAGSATFGGDMAVVQGEVSGKGSGVETQFEPFWYWYDRRRS